METFVNAVLPWIIGFIVFAWGMTVLPHVLARVPYQNAPTVKGRLDRGEGVLLIDVREPKEFNGPMGHVPGALNIPGGTLARRIMDKGSGLENLKDTPVVLVCGTAQRAAVAARIMRKLGFTDLTVLRGGVHGWTKAGYPLEGKDRA